MGNLPKSAQRLDRPLQRVDRPTQQSAPTMGRRIAHAIRRLLLRCGMPCCAARTSKTWILINSEIMSSFNLVSKSSSFVTPRCPRHHICPARPPGAGRSAHLVQEAVSRCRRRRAGAANHANRIESKRSAAARHRRTKKAGDDRAAGGAGDDPREQPVRDELLDHANVVHRCHQ